MEEPPFSLGQHVDVPWLNTTGVVRFIGLLPIASGFFLGLELADAVGRNDGAAKGHRYFTCRPNHGLFVSVNKLLDATATSRDASTSFKRTVSSSLSVDESPQVFGTPGSPFSTTSQEFFTSQPMQKPRLRSRIPQPSSSMVYYTPNSTRSSSDTHTRSDAPARQFSLSSPMSSAQPRTASLGTSRGLDRSRTENLGVNTRVREPLQRTLSLNAPPDEYSESSKDKTLLEDPSLHVDDGRPGNASDNPNYLSLETELDSLRRRIQSLEEQHEHDEAAFASLRRQHELDQDALASLQRQRKTDQDEITALQRRHNIAEGEIASLQRRHNIDNDQISSLQRQLQFGQDSLASLKRQHETDLADAARNHEATLQREKENALASLKESSSSSLDAVIMEKASLQEQIQFLTQQLKDSQPITDSGPSQNSADSEHIKSLTERIEQLTAENAELKALKELSDKLDEAYKEIEAQYLAEIEDLKTANRDIEDQLDAYVNGTNKLETGSLVESGRDSALNESVLSHEDSLHEASIHEPPPRESFFAMQASVQKTMDLLHALLPGLWPIVEAVVPLVQKLEYEAGRWGGVTGAAGQFMQQVLLGSTTDATFDSVCNDIHTCLSMTPRMAIGESLVSLALSTSFLTHARSIAPSFRLGAALAARFIYQGILDKLERHIGQGHAHLGPLIQDTSLAFSKISTNLTRITSAPTKDDYEMFLESLSSVHTLESSLAAGPSQDANPSLNPVALLNRISLSDYDSTNTSTVLERRLSVYLEGPQLKMSSLEAARESQVAKRDLAAQIEKCDLLSLQLKTIETRADQASRYMEDLAETRAQLAAAHDSTAQLNAHIRTLHKDIDSLTEQNTVLENKAAESQPLPLDAALLTKQGMVRTIRILQDQVATLKSHSLASYLDTIPHSIPHAPTKLYSHAGRTFELPVLGETHSEDDKKTALRAAHRSLGDHLILNLSKTRIPRIGSTPYTDAAASLRASKESLGKLHHLVKDLENVQRTWLAS